MNAPISKEQFEAALAQCASEPIHLIGRVQSHGAALVMAPDKEHTVLQVSANLGDFLGAEARAALGAPLATLIGAGQAARVTELVAHARTARSATGLLHLPADGQLRACDAHVYSTDECFALELSWHDATDLETRLAGLLLGLQRAELERPEDGDPVPYFAELARVVRSLTGYDNVMVYRFDADWNGEVICQSRAGHATDFLGIHFPASDIPPQARKLYTINPVRFVADVDDKPVPIVPVMNPRSGRPLDMSHSALRSLSPIHIEYLRNIGVRASMTISLLQDGQLWGMVVCHHMTPKPGSIALRQAGALISKLASRKLSSMAASRYSTLLTRATNITQGLWQALPNASFRDVLERILPELQSLLDASGVVVIRDGVQHAFGLTPGVEHVEAIYRLVRATSTSEVFHTDNLAGFYEPAGGFMEPCSGLLVTPLSSVGDNCVLWFRSERRHSVQWAGHYEEGFVLNDAGGFRLTPRKSFELWQETWHGRSAPWLPVEVGVAVTTARVITESLRTVGEHRPVDAAALSARSASGGASETVATLAPHGGGLLPDWQIASVVFNEVSQTALAKLTRQLPGVLFQFHRFPDGRSRFPYASGGIEMVFEVLPFEVLNDASIVSSRVHPDDMQRLRESVDESARTLEPWQCEYRVNLPTRGQRWLAGLANPERLPDGGTLWHGFISDITDRKAMEAASLKLSLERDELLGQVEKRARLLNDLVENLAFGVVLYDTDRQIVASNQSAVRLLVPAGDELAAGTLEFDDLVRFHEFLQSQLVPDDAGDRVSATELLGGANERRFEAVNEMGVPIEVHLLPLVSGWTLVTYSDITGHKSTEGVLARARVEAEAANMAKSAFLAAMSHEIRTPLNAISGMAFLLANSALDPEQASEVRAIQVASKNLMSLVNDVLDFSKIEAGELEIDRHQFSLSELLDEVRLLAEAIAAVKGLEVRVDPLCVEIPDQVVGDGNRVRQMLMNYLGNAVKFTEQGWVALRVLPTGPAADAASGRLNLRFEVEDTGIGISEDAQSHLFQAFQQADSSVSRYFGGTGLGLSIVKRLAGLLGGSFGVRSQPGEGSLFWFELPFEPGAAQAGDEAGERAGGRVQKRSDELADKRAFVTTDRVEESGRGVESKQKIQPAAHDPLLTGVRILVVDDSQLNLDVVQRLLGREGAQVLLAGSGQRGLALLDEHTVDLALVDLHMPQMDGFEVVRQIRDNPRHRHLPLLALSAGVTTQERDSAFAAGVDAFVPKPVEPARLVSEIRAHVDGVLAGAGDIRAAERPTQATHSGVQPDGDTSPSERDPGSESGLQAEGPGEEWPQIEGIDAEIAFEAMCGDAGFFLRMLGKFREEHPSPVNLIKGLLDSGDISAASERVHKMRGQAATLGAMDLHRAASGLENALAEQLADISGELTRFEEACGVVFGHERGQS